MFINNRSLKNYKEAFFIVVVGLVWSILVQNHKLRLMTICVKMALMFRGNYRSVKNHTNPTITV